MKVCDVNASCGFRGKFITTSALEKYHKGLTGAQKAIHNAQRTFIESVNDGKEYVYEVFGKYKKYATIYEKNMKGTQEKFAPLFSDYVQHSGDLFDSLYKKYQLEFINARKRV